MEVVESMSEPSIPAYSVPVPEAEQETAPVRICFMASGGGHFQELCGLAGLAQRYRHSLISTDVNKALAEACPFHRVHEIEEIGQGFWKKSPVKVFRMLWRILRILLREKPNLVISTGAGIAVPGFLAARLLGIRTVYIESYARVQSLSLTGKICYRLAHLFLVQHASLASRLPRAVYAGTLSSFLDADSHETGSWKSAAGTPEGEEGRAWSL